ncbi:hypothetical protein CICLE_v10003972mg [Citrus x clementina]|uniref:Uncharacterized protein n=1 Tax=Citrus clementina TaxID=85681 RepID=V4SB63_CITCL|nr:hypothetical protein CICLE_v10003972mg [Citrus x clementina]
MVCRNKTEDELTVTGPNISKQTKDAESWKDSVFMVINSDDQEKDEYYGRYWPLYRMIEKNDWQGVEDFVTNHPDALTAKIVEPGSMTIFHMIVELLIDAESDEAICLLDKLASKVDPETLARQDNHGHTAATLSAAKGNLRALKLLVTHGVDIYSGKDGANVLSFLIAANLYDVASDLLKRHPTIGRDSIDSRRIILNTLAQKPYAFASGSRLGRLQRLIYNCSCQLSFANTQTHLYSDLLMKKPSFQ